MSEQSRSVANDLLRLEMQLAMVGSQEVVTDEAAKGSGSVTGSTTSRTSRTSHRSGRNNRSSARSSSSGVSKRSKMTVVAPPGKLGIILANKADSKGTVVSGVRTSSVLAEKISPGDRIIAIDGEDVSLMTVSEITTIMARKSDFERQLTIMTTPKHLGLSSRSDYHSSEAADGYYGRR
jgi:C-terminal processing protease CtpA/Prc